LLAVLRLAVFGLRFSGLRSLACGFPSCGLLPKIERLHSGAGLALPLPLDLLLRAWMSALPQFPDLTTAAYPLISDLITTAYPIISDLIVATAYPRIFGFDLIFGFYPPR